ncbi:MAG TPA: LysM peptidoglycan-binding domain-containing protein [Anaerolineaceae bacterium]|nr:LysM peptidoglycan-binding domain-containing protein [Anaerolineaceae bacterium]
MTLPAAATPNGQVYYLTPTPQIDGRIIYIVKANDTCTSIGLLNNITVDRIRELNNIQDPACPLTPGQELLLGVVESMNQTPTPGPSPTPTVPMPTATPPPGQGDVCIYLYNDINGNALAEDGEAALPGGVVSLINRDGTINLNGETTQGIVMEDMLCFRGILEGDYNISVAAPQGYNPTTSMNQALKLVAGEKSQVNFGAQINSRPPEDVTQNPQDAPQQGGVSPLLGILGGLLLVAGVGLGIYVARLRR